MNVTYFDLLDLLDDDFDDDDHINSIFLGFPSPTKELWDTLDDDTASELQTYRGLAFPRSAS